MASCGRVDFEQPASLWIDAPPGPAGSAWRSDGLTLAEAIREALATEPRLHPAIRITAAAFPAPLDFEHVRALHGHPDYPRKRVGPARARGTRRTRITIDIESSDEAAGG